MSRRVVVIGAGVGGLAAALDARGARPGGAWCSSAPQHPAARCGDRDRRCADRCRPDRLHDALGVRGDVRRGRRQPGDHLTLRPVEILARHAWDGDAAARPFRRHRRLGRRDRRLRRAGRGARLPAISSRGRSGSTRRWTALHPRRAAEPACRSASPGGARRRRPAGATTPFSDAVERRSGELFHDPRLRQLFGRYATYCGSSPFRAPATLMLVAHVEQEGVWLVEGGMHRIARALAGLAGSEGRAFRYGAEVARDPAEGGRAAACGSPMARCSRPARSSPMPMSSALGTGPVRPGRGRRRCHAVPGRALALGRDLGAAGGDRGLSAAAAQRVLLPRLPGRVRRSSVRAALPAEPTVYVCAQDRGDDDGPGRPERLLCLINAPARGDTTPLHGRRSRPRGARASA